MCGDAALLSKDHRGVTVRSGSTGGQPAHADINGSAT